MLVFDTSAYSHFIRGDAQELGRIVQGASEVALPCIVAAELKAGFKAGNRERANLALLEKFLNADNTSVLYVDAATVDIYAAVWSELRSKSKPIPTNDVWIAALCLQHQSTLVTADSDFQYVPLLNIISWQT